MFFDEYCTCDTCTMFFYLCIGYVLCVLGMYCVAAVCILLSTEHITAVLSRTGGGFGGCGCT